jgi:hypothetical protein
VARVVYLVAGPPCAGKSTYVRHRARPGDLVLDQDVIGARAMAAGMRRVAAMTDGTAWVIRCAPGPTRRAELAAELGAEVVLLRPDDATLIARAAARPHPRRAIQAVRDWIRREAEDKPPGRQTRGRGTPRPTTTQRGYGWEHQQARAAALRELARAGQGLCPFCSLPMTPGMPLDYDHYPPLVYGPGPRVRRLSHRSCNRRAGQRLAMQRRQQSTIVVNSRRW